jgi:hypothetical protein
MATGKTIDEIEQSFAYQIRQWRVQRIAWWILVLLWLAALLGFFGRGGPLSRTTVGDVQSPVRLEYERFARVQAPQELRLHMRGLDASADRVQVWLSSQYLQDTEVSAVEPEPETVKSAGQGLIYTFVKEKGVTDLDATFSVKAQAFGPLKGQIGSNNRPQHAFSQFVYP